MSTIDKCEVCGKTTSVQYTGTFDGLSIDCRRCGFYEISKSALGSCRQLSTREKVRISGWLRGQSENGVTPRIIDSDIGRIAKMPMPTTAERANFLLQYIERHEERMGDLFTQDDLVYTAVAYAREAQERDEIFKFLEWSNYIDAANEKGERRISPGGYQHLDSLRQLQPNSSQAFVAMWFNPDLKAIYDDGFSRGILAAGYNPIRVDRVEHANKIDDEIIAQIRRSKFVVADFTGHRGGVYFEAGFALGLNLPVIWSCREDDLDKLHFDLRQYNCLSWQNDPADLARRLQMRIEAVLGRGPIEATAE